MMNPFDTLPKELEWILRDMHYDTLEVDLELDKMSTYTITQSGVIIYYDFGKTVELCDETLTITTKIPAIRTSYNCKRELQAISEELQRCKSSIIGRHYFTKVEELLSKIKNLADLDELQVKISTLRKDVKCDIESDRQEKLINYLRDGGYELDKETKDLLNKIITQPVMTRVLDIDNLDVD